MSSVSSNLVPALWVAWLVYWWIESLATHAVRRRESVASRLSHTVPLVIGIVLARRPDPPRLKPRA